MCLAPTPIRTHSHMRGINMPWSCRSTHKHDSFPHVWDKLNIPQSLVILAPTHSHLRGICKHHRSILFRTSMHSHSCVENRCVYHYIAANGESFPRMWNKRSDKWRWCDCVRLTPTFVGQKVIMSKRPSRLNDSFQPALDRKYLWFPWLSKHSHIYGK